MYFRISVNSGCFIMFNHVQPFYNRFWMILVFRIQDWFLVSRTHETQMSINEANISRNRATSSCPSGLCWPGSRAYWPVRCLAFALSRGNMSEASLRRRFPLTIDRRLFALRRRSVMGIIRPASCRAAPDAGSERSNQVRVA